MSDKKRLEKAYRDLQAKEIPDLWSRIEDQLSPRELRQAETSEQVKEKRSNYRFEAGLAAAACCILLAIGGLRAQNGAMFEQAPPIMEETASKDDGGSGEGKGSQGAEEMAAGTAAGPEASMEGKNEAESGAESVAEPVQGQRNQTGPSEIPELDFPGNYGPVRYEALALSGKEPKAPPENSSYVPEDHYYFTEADLRNTGLLCQVKVLEAGYEAEEDGTVHDVNYEVVIDKILYSEDYVKEQEHLLVKGTLVGNGPEDAARYQMKEGGTYILPLAYEDGVYRLVYPNAPQIEVTQDTRYVFHTGWSSLVDQKTAVVLKTAYSPNDYFYDRMVIRSDEEFLTNLTTLVETERENETRS